MYTVPCILSKSSFGGDDLIFKFSSFGNNRKKGG